MKLDIGCGKYKREGYLGVDLKKFDGVDYPILDLRGDWPFKNGEVDEIYTSHFLEHLTDNEVVDVLKEAARVLKPGGQFEVIVPDLPGVLNEFLKADFNSKWSWWIQTIFGNQAHEGEFHKTGFDSEKLEIMLSNTGFIVTSIESVFDHNQPSLRALAVKKHATTD